MYGSKVLLTDGWDELIKVAVGEKRLRKLSEKQLQRSGDDVNVLPLTVLQVQLLCGDTSGAQLVKTQQGAPLSAVKQQRRNRFASSAGRITESWAVIFYRDLPWSVVSEWRRGSRSLCRVRRCLSLEVNTSAPVSQVLLHVAQQKYPTVIQAVEQTDSLPLFSTALIHFSTNLGTVEFSCAHSVARWQPNTLSTGKKNSSISSSSRIINAGDIGNPVNNRSNYLWCILSPWQTAAWAASSGTSSAWFEPSSGRRLLQRSTTVRHSAWRLERKHNKWDV